MRRFCPHTFNLNTGKINFEEFQEEINSRFNFTSENKSPFKKKGLIVDKVE